MYSSTHTYIHMSNLLLKITDATYFSYFAIKCSFTHVLIFTDTYYIYAIVPECLYVQSLYRFVPKSVAVCLLLHKQSVYVYVT